MQRPAGNEITTSLIQTFAGIRIIRKSLSHVTAAARYVLLLGSVLITTCASGQQTASPSTITVLEHVAVVDVNQGSLAKDMSVVIRNGRIELVKPFGEYRAPKGAKIVDLTGRYLVPGFVEMHAHLFMHPWDDKGNIMSQYDREVILRILRLLLASGITTVRDPGSETEAAVTLRSLINDGKVIGPRVLTAGRILSTGTSNPEPFIHVNDEAGVRREIRWQADAGVDFIKVYASMPPPLVKAAIDEAHAHNLPVIGHLGLTTWTQGAEMGIDAITHSAPWSEEYLPPALREGYCCGLFARVYWLRHLDLNSPEVIRMVDLMAKNHVTVDPTLIAMHTKFWGNNPRYTQNPLNRLAPELLVKGWLNGRFTASWTNEQYGESQTQWGKIQALTKKMFDAGVMLTVGTDTPTPWIVPGPSYHDELQLLREVGISNQDVLKLATLNGAKALKLENEIGLIRAGMKADLVVLQANPLENIKHMRQIELVIQGGTIYVPQELLENK